MNFERTEFFESVESVSGVIKSKAEEVIMTFTSAFSFLSSLIKYAALYAAILPQTPSKIFLPLNTVGIYEFSSSP